MSKDIYVKAIELYGKRLQLIVAIEELSELIQAVTKTLRDESPKALLNVAEEIADVEIMLEQLRLIFECEAEVETFKSIKLKRLELKVKGEEDGGS